MPTPMPIPLPISFGPHEADWWLVAVTALGILLTAVIAALALWANVKANASRKVADRAQVQALQASTDAFNASRAATEKQIDLLRQVVTTPTDARPSLPTVRWEVSRDGKERWLLRNVGTATAKGTTVSGLTDQDETDLHVFLDEQMDVEPGSTIPFAIWRSLASPPATVIVVEWVGDDNEVASQRMVVV